jgi:glycosyltransferase involved in cell wall biosynthesis
MNLVSINYSIIIPVYNRPQELQKLLDSLVAQTFAISFEVVVVEDGSDNTSKKIVNSYSDKLNVHYFVKGNSGPGLSRNFGMQKASGDYFIILDSDCILPSTYLQDVDIALKHNFTDAYGGKDASHPSFSNIQKAISYSMTSVLTTGGIRGHKNLASKFQLRSFNMGLSKIAFEKTNGFGSQRFGEDIDLTFRLWQNGFESQFIEKAFVFHKRRTHWRSFFKQTFNFGAARPILNNQHPTTSQITYWFPSLFIVGLLFSIIVYMFNLKIFLYGYFLYFILIFFGSLIANKSPFVAMTSMYATLVQFLGYGTGFLRSTFRLYILKKSVKDTFPRMFS